MKKRDDGGSPKLRRLLIGLLAILGLVAAACGSPQDEDDESADTAAAADDGSDDTSDTTAAEDEAPAEDEAAGEPIKIGLIAPLTGPGAAAAADAVKGWELYWEQNGASVAGRTIEWSVEDEGACDPNLAQNKAEKLLDVDQVAFIVGPMCGNDAPVVAEWISQRGDIALLPIASTDDLTQRTPYDGVIRVGGWTSSQVHHPFGEWAYEQGYRRVVTMCWDYQYGWESCGGFARTFKEKGGEIIDAIWNPIGTQDFAPYITQIRDAEPDAVFVQQGAADAVRLLQAWKDFGLDESITLLGGESVGDQSAIRSLGALAEGLISVGKFPDGGDDPALVEFVTAYEDAYSEIPSYYSNDMYVAAKWIAQALEEVGGDVSDKAAFVAAIQAQTVEGPTGAYQLDEYGNPRFNVYVREVVARDDGQFVNKPIETYPDVSQFWTYDPDEYLADPVYTREYQG
jgi:branched-chain amino acid transport system substrate-binding protein